MAGRQQKTTGKTKKALQILVVSKAPLLYVMQYTPK